MRRIRLLKHFDGKSPGAEIVVTDHTAFYLTQGEDPVAELLIVARPAPSTAERRPRGVAKETR